MKKLLQILLLILVAVPALHAQDAQRIYIKVGDTTNSAAVPLELYLNAPTLDITAMEIYLALPQGATMQAGVLSSGCAQTHALVEGATPSGHFVSIASCELAGIASSETPVCTWLCDFSQLANGEYSINATDLFAVSVTTDGVENYTAENQEEKLALRNGAVTSIEEMLYNKGGQKIYNLKGQLLSVPQKGAINIINGKKIKL